MASQPVGVIDGCQDGRDITSNGHVGVSGKAFQGKVATHCATLSARITGRSPSSGELPRCTAEPRREAAK